MGKPIPPRAFMGHTPPLPLRNDKGERLWESEEQRLFWDDEYREKKEKQLERERKQKNVLTMRFDWRPESPIKALIVEVVSVGYIVFLLWYFFGYR